MKSKHAERIMDKYPNPLNHLLLDLVDYNYEKWLKPPYNRTIGAEDVRKTGLTANQREWANMVKQIMSKTVLSCPNCNEAVDRNRNHRRWKDGGVHVEEGEEWKCRECGHTFGEPIRRVVKNRGGL